MEWRKTVKAEYSFSDKCLECDLQAEYGEGICATCKVGKETKPKRQRQ